MHRTIPASQLLWASGTGRTVAPPTLERAFSVVAMTGVLCKIAANSGTKVCAPPMLESQSSKHRMTGTRRLSSRWRVTARASAPMLRDPDEGRGAPSGEVWASICDSTACGEEVGVSCTHTICRPVVSPTRAKPSSNKWLSCLIRVRQRPW